MQNNYSLYNIIKDCPYSKASIIKFSKDWDEFSEYTWEKFLTNLDLPTICFKEYKILLYDFFDAQEIICIIKLDNKFKYVPVIDGKSLQPNKTHIWSKHGLETREQAEYDMFRRAFQYLETKLNEN